MRKASPFSFFICSLLGAVLVGGIAHLFQLRFTAGDIYPTYSSLRTDPQGTRVFFESIHDLAKIEAGRNLRPLRRKEANAGTTLLFLGVNQRLSDAMVEEIERFLKAGARVVVTYYPFEEEDEVGLRRLRRGSSLEASEGEDNVEIGKDIEMDLAGNLGETFGFELRFKEGPPERKGLPLSALQTEAAVWDGNGAPDFWLSRLYLNPNEEWETLLQVGGEPVVMQRAVQEGTLVVMTDSYWLSNEAMSLTRRTPFAAWAIGSSRTIIFEETHLGLADHDRLSHLMRRLNLEALLAVLVLLAILFIWKNGVAFPPREPLSDPMREGAVAGYDSQKGLVNLLRANVSTEKIFSLCWEEWLKGLERAERIRLARRIEAAAEVVEASQRKGWIDDYRKVTAILNERKNVCKPQIQNSKD